MPKPLFFGLLLLLLPGPARAATSASPELEYPELAVTPRASERLQREAAREGGAWLQGLPFYISGAATLTAGVIQGSHYRKEKDPDGTSGLGGVIVGSAWIVGSAVLYGLYHPYSLTEVTALPSKTPREQLARERAAEEALEAPAHLIDRLSWISMLSNFAVSTYMLTNAESGTVAVPANLIAMAASVLPILFPSHWTVVASEQRDYRKRIYAPIASAAAYIEPGSGRLAPGLALSLNF